MLKTPTQARDLWCPMVRIARDEAITIETAKVGDIVAITEERHIVAGCNRDALGGGNRGEHGEHRPLASCRCIADKCAMWRWAPKLEAVQPGFWSLTRFPRFKRAASTHGFCGLAGSPAA